MFEIRLYKSRRKSLVLLLISTILTSATVFVLYKDINHSVLIYIGLILFGPVVIIGLFNLVDQRPQIIINGDGIFDRNNKLGVIPWHNILFAETFSIQGQSYIGLHCNENYTSAKRRYRWEDAIKEKLNVPEVVVYTTQLKVKSEPLCKLINELKESAIKDHKIIVENFKTINSLI